MAALNFYLTSWPQGKRAITLSSREIIRNRNKFIVVPLKESKKSANCKQSDFIYPWGRKKGNNRWCCLLLCAVYNMYSAHSGALLIDYSHWSFEAQELSGPERSQNLSRKVNVGFLTTLSLWLTKVSGWGWYRGHILPWRAGHSW